MDYNIFILIPFGSSRLSIEQREKHIVKYFVFISYSMSDRLDRGDKNDETSTDVDASFSCADCGQQFKSRQELKEHESTQH
jgi:hypothetical protein